jgi:MFS transporter, DHA2 family, multidrug resistance protein
VSNVLANRGQFHQTRLVELIIPSSTAYQNALQQITDYFVMQGNSLGKANLQAIAWIGQQFQTQVAMLASMDVFWVLMLVARAAIPLALLPRHRLLLRAGVRVAGAATGRKPATKGAGG